MLNNIEEYPEHIQAKLKKMNLDKYSIKEILKISIKSSLEIKHLIESNYEPKGILSGATANLDKSTVKTLSEAESLILEYMKNNYESIR